MAKKKTRVTVKQRKLIRGLVKGKTMMKAAQDAGFTGKPETARVNGHKALQNDTVKKAFGEALDDAGLGMDSLAEEVSKGIKNADYGKHDSYVKLALTGHGVGKEEEKKDFMRLEVVIGAKGVTEDERMKYAEALVAIRITRGLHPSENRKLNEKEQDYFKKLLEEGKRL